MERRTAVYIIDVIMGLSFLIAFVTGVVKFPELTNYFLLVFRVIPSYYMTKVHDYAGMIMGIMVFIHLAMNWSWIVTTTKEFFKK